MKASLLLIASFAKKVVNKVCFMHQIILQLKGALNNTFSKESYADTKKLQYLVLLQC